MSVNQHGTEMTQSGEEVLLCCSAIDLGVAE
jgi:hypothetical protein